MSHQLRNFDLSHVQGLSKKALDLHLGLYKGYVDNFNQLLEQATQKSPLTADGYARRFAFEYNGVALHELFFEALAGQKQAPQAGSGFSAALGTFGGFEGWKAAVEALGKTRGVGWVLTVRERFGERRLHNCWIDLHQLNVPANTDVVFALDLWEHAFMIDFAPSQRADYMRIVFDNIDWGVVESRCERAKVASQQAA